MIHEIIYAIRVYLKKVNAFDAVAKLPVPPEKNTIKLTGVLAATYKTLLVVKQSVPRVASMHGLRSNAPDKQSASQDLEFNDIPYIT